MSNNNNHITDDLLVKYLLGEADTAEQGQVEKWISGGTENKKYFDHLKLIWEESKQQATSQTVDENKAWQRFRQRIHGPAKETTKRTKTYGWLRIAALFIIIAGCAWLAYTIYNVPAEELVVQSQDKVLTDTLPDGSVITLNKNSVLSYPERFKGNTRAVVLRGEAFFKVTPDKQKPFLISSDGVTIKVIGTSFNVRNENGSIEVIVETGIVEVTHRNKSIQLRRGEKTVVRPQDSTITKEAETEELYNYYRTKEFVCDNTPLWKLVAALNEAYDANIVIEREDLRTTPITTTFHNESLDRILEIIRLTLNISVTRAGDKIILR